MARIPNSVRRGLSLTEVLVALFVMAIGVVSAITLFPIGVDRTRRAVLDTRITRMAYEADATIKMMEWEYDNDIKIPTSDVTGMQTLPPQMGYDDFNNLFGIIPTPNGGALDTFVVPGGGMTREDMRLTTSGVGFPVWIDPILKSANVLRDAGIANGNFPRLEFTVTPGQDDVLLPFDQHFGNVMAMPKIFPGVPVYSLEKARLFPNRENFARKWFVSEDDVTYSSTNLVVPFDPVRTSTLDEEYYLQLTNSTSTVERNPQYSWSFIVVPEQMDSVPWYTDPPTNTMLGGTYLRPQEDKLRIIILSYYKRNLSAPYRTVRACFFNNSVKATLSWPDTGAIPDVRVGTWLIEYTASGARRTGQVGGDPHEYRHAVTYHRVVDIGDPVASGGQVHLVVTLEKPMTNYPTFMVDTNGNSVADQRTLPDLYTDADTFPVEFAPGTVPMTTYITTDPSVIWVPVLIMDGLQEIFEVSQ